MKNNKIIMYFTILNIFTSSTMIFIVQSFNETNNQCLNNFDFNKSSINFKSRHSVDLDCINDLFLMNEVPALDKFYEPSYKPQCIETAKEYNWANFEDQNWLTPVRSQGYCGSCWVFAANGILESVIKIREKCPKLNPDLSEQYVLSCIPLAGNCQGGWTYLALKYMKDTTPEGNYFNGALLESCFAYVSDDTILCSEKCDDWQEALVPINNCGYWVSNGSLQDRDSIKNQIIMTGPVACSILATSDFIQWGYNHNSPDEYFPYSSCDGGINHIIIIVGWKDDETISNGGYWSCKNSWGTDWGYNGFFNIEYGSLNMESDYSQIVWVDYDPNSYDWSPVADAEGPYCGFIDEEIILRADCSFDAEGEISSYLWDVEGDQKEGIITNYSFQNSGDYHGTLTVVDSCNRTDTNNFIIQVQSRNDPPNKPLIEGPVWGRIFQKYEYSIIVDDPDGNDVFFYIDWGDNDSVIWDGPYSSNEKVVMNHVWSVNDFHAIKIKAKDTFGFESEETKLNVYIQKEKCIMNKFFEFLEDHPRILSLFIRFLEIFYR